MNEEDLGRPGFYVSHEACYRDSIKYREIMVGDYPEGGGTRGEFGIRWIPLGGYETPRLEVFSEGWEVLQEMIERFDLVRRLADLEDALEDPEPEQVAALLLDLGFEDLTKRAKLDNAEAAEIRRGALEKLTPAERSALGFGGRP